MWVGQFIGPSFHYTVIDFIAWVSAARHFASSTSTQDVLRALTLPSPLLPLLQVPHFTKFVCRFSSYPHH